MDVQEGGRTVVESDNLHKNTSYLSTPSTVPTPIMKSSSIKTDTLGSSPSPLSFRAEKPPAVWRESTITRSYGEIVTYTKQSYFLLYQTSPIWLLAMAMDEIEKVYVASLDHLCQSFASSPIFSPLFDQIWVQNRNKIEESKMEDVFTSSSIVMLVSGSIEFICSQSALVQHSPFLGIVDGYHKARRRFPDDTLSWHQVTHSYIGGASNFSTLWCC